MEPIFVDNVHYFANIVSGTEGGTSDHKDDKGGYTHRGITEQVFLSAGQDYNRDNVIDRKDMLFLNDERIRAIIRAGGFVWHPTLLKLHRELAFFLIDARWGSGTLMKWIKVVLKSVTATDNIDQALSLISSFSQNNQAMLAAILNVLMEQYFDGLPRRDPTQTVFIRGWSFKRIQTSVRMLDGIYRPHSDKTVTRLYIPYNPQAV